MANRHAEPPGEVFPRSWAVINNNNELAYAGLLNSLTFREANAIPRK
jgi:hypothetical protein